MSQALFIGLDVEAWLREGLIDVLTVGSGHAPRNMMQPLQDMVALGAAYHTPVYAAIAAEASAMASGPSAVDAWRGAATNIRRAGAGVYTFNFFPQSTDPMFALLSQMGEQQTLDGRNRAYGLDNQTTDALSAGRVLRGNPYGSPDLRWNDRVPDPLPKVLVADWNDFRIAVGEDLAASAPKSVDLIVGLSASKVSDWIELKVNGVLITPSGGIHPDAGGACSAACPAQLLQEGMNAVGVLLDVRGAFDDVPRVVETLDLFVEHE